MRVIAAAINPSVKEVFTLQVNDSLSPGRGFSSYTPSLVGLGGRSINPSLPLAPDASFFNSEEKALGEVLYQSALRAIEVGDLDSLQDYIPDLWALHDLNKKHAAALEEVSILLKKAEVCRDFYERLYTYLSGYLEPSERKIADFLHRLASDTPRSNPVKIRTYEEMMEIFKLVIAQIKKSTIEQYEHDLKATYGAPLEEVVPKVARFGLELEVLLNGFDEIPSIYAALEEFAIEDERFLTEVIKSSPHRFKLLHALKRKELLSNEMHLMAPPTVESHKIFLDSSVKTYETRINEMSAERDLVSTPMERKEFLEKQVFLYKAVLQAMKIESIIVKAFLEPSPEKEEFRWALTLSELRVSLHAVFDLSLKIAQKSLKDSGIYAGDNEKERAMLAKFQEEFRLKFLPVSLELSSFDFDEAQERGKLPDKIRLLARKFGAECTFWSEKVEAYHTEKLTHSEPIAELVSKLNRARIKRYRELMARPEPDFELRARDPEVEGLEKNLRLATPGTRQAQIHHLLKLGLAPNATDAAGENLVFHVLRARVDREIKMEMLYYLIKQGALVNVISAEGLRLGALVLTDKAALNYIYRVELALHRSLVAADVVGYMERLKLELQRAGSSQSWSEWSSSFFVPSFPSEAQYSQSMLECMVAYQLRVYEEMAVLRRRVEGVEELARRELVPA